MAQIVNEHIEEDDGVTYTITEFDNGEIVIT